MTVGELIILLSKEALDLPLVAEGCDCMNNVIGFRIVRGTGIIMTTNLPDHYLKDESGEDEVPWEPQPGDNVMFERIIFEAPSSK